MRGDELSSLEGPQAKDTRVFFYGQNAPKIGKPPAVILVNPKYDHNVGSVVRAASCFGVEQVWFTGERVTLQDGQRLPREERMRGYMDVELYQADRPFDAFEDVVPVAIELMPGSENLAEFDHPENAVYVFGPEDGSIPSVLRQHCHRFVTIPTYHCTNLAAAVYITLYDRILKEGWNGKPFPSVGVEQRGWGS